MNKAFIRKRKAFHLHPFEGQSELYKFLYNFNVSAFLLRFYWFSRNIPELQSCRSEMRGAAIETITVQHSLKISRYSHQVQKCCNSCFYNQHGLKNLSTMLNRNKLVDCQSRKVIWVTY